MAAWEHPGYIDPAIDADMEILAEANAKREEERLLSERTFRNLHHRFVADKWLRPFDNNNDNVYLEK